MKKLSLLLLAALTFGLASTSHAVDLFWSADGTGVTCGGVGTWNTTSSQWSTQSCSGTFQIWANSTNNTATFPGSSSSYTVTLGTNMTVGKLTNALTGTNVLTLTAKQITFGGPSPQIDVVNKLTMTSPMLGAVTLTKTGVGNLQLNNNGQTISKYFISGGIISTANTNKWGSGVGSAQDALTLDGGGIGIDTGSQTNTYFGITLTTNGGSVGVYTASLTYALNTKITGPGGLTLGGGAVTTPGYNAAGNYILGNTNNDFTNNITLTKGTLFLGASGVIPDTAQVSVASGTVFNLNNFDETVKTITSSGTISLGSGTLTLANPSSQTFSGPIGGSGGLIKAGTGTITLSGANNYTGVTAINNGTIAIATIATVGSPGPLGAPTTVANGTIPLGSGTRLRAP